MNTKCVFFCVLILFYGILKITKARHINVKTYEY